MFATLAPTAMAQLLSLGQVRIGARMGPPEVVERFFTEVWNGRHFGVLDEIVDPDCVTHQVRSASDEITAVARGPVALQKHIQSWLAAFPNMKVTTDLRCVCGNDVVSWVTMRGRHTGPWQDVRPTGREVTIRTVAQHRIENGRFVKDWVIVGSEHFARHDTSWTLGAGRCLTSDI